jgi:hypothetical protein
MRAVFVDDNPLSDFTLPLIALVRGKKVSKRLREHFDEVAIEELPLPTCHLGNNIEDTSMTNLCEIYYAYLKRMFEAFAPMAFAVQDRLLAGATRRVAVSATTWEERFIEIHTVLQVSLKSHSLSHPAPLYAGTVCRCLSQSRH